MEILSVIEHERIPIRASRREGEHVLTEAHAEALSRLEARLPKRTFAWGHHVITFAQHCGVVSLGDLCLEILPKIHGREESPGACRTALIHLLKRARRLKTTPVGQGAMGRQTEVLLDVFLIYFCDLLQAQLMQGMLRGYVEKEENLHVVRGRIKLDMQFKHNLAHGERVYCCYDEMSVDTPHNQMIKSVLRQMQQFASGTTARKRIARLLMQFADIRDIPADLTFFESLAFDRTTCRFKEIFGMCRMFLEGLHPDVVAGDMPCLALIFDMNRLFEAYVSDIMRRNAGKRGLRMREQGPKKYMAIRPDTGNELFLMKPDMVFLDESTPVALADAKWKILNENGKNLGITQGDLYQMSAYAARYGIDTLALIYPRQAKLTSPVEFRLQGDARVTIRVIPIDVIPNGTTDIIFP
ncbi:McrC family protein [Desulfoluna butyratoxydans]|uniref:5-methylcytosine restriction system component n=1 Tax=Desulfoluna butyratoxydans TaxID=231438 RepID=A0A4V6YUF6_9BACT|nr:restriction endonuclease [Desulfoluna butyratoxydans]VFQ46728.1 5-methylcytosine restriction system component [Desulfoluna butyratoxydans]